MHDTSLSLPDINNTVSIPKKKSSFLANFMAFSGPGTLVAVGYMDPGNWITSIQGGALYGYLLLSVILISSLIAMLLQAMCVKLGIVTGMDLAQATKSRVSKPVARVLWFTTELAIMATEIAEIIGSAVALNLLFDIPLLLGVLITIADVFLLLLLTKFGFRKIESFVFVLIMTIFAIFAYEVALAQPDLAQAMSGFIPQKSIFTANVTGYDSALLIALGIVGATVMPHNLYLHSSIVQTRKYNRNSNKDLQRAVKYATIDSNLQLGFSFIINCLLLLLGASLFFGKDPDQFGRFVQLYDALQQPDIVGPIASGTLATLFAVALLASGQNATITGTLSGQIVMEGFLNIKLPMWLRRLITRSIAVLPVVASIIIWGDRGDVVESLLIYSQVFLSLALPISMIPLIAITSKKEIMGEFVNAKSTTALGWLLVSILTLLNLQLIYETLSGVL
ncbi:Nramp family divalent metal transporter [Vibrio sp. S4M6]|uniref:Nramp family divalent metal transporter n=1 Tax=Vibrio sinus TaxID=2946865 RepID=UPI00202AA973|nr:Nramp family divalent metal transporter [Vibrio sinus]MCL9780697.1 Nramp family divalent metal transporter [Vibrio sinus]